MHGVESSASEVLERGRDSYQRRRWAEAFLALSKADEIEPLDADDLCILGWSAHLSGRDLDFARAMGRAYRVHLDAGEQLRAARCAGWLGTILGVGGEAGPAAGWLNRAKRLVERAGVDCPERGFLLLTNAFEHMDAGDLDAMFVAASQALEVAERFGDADTAAIALVLQGRARLARGEIRSGLAMLDEAMVSVTNDELLPAMTGLTYCSVIEGCREVYDLRRSQEWTAALARWCDGQPELSPMSGNAWCIARRFFSCAGTGLRRWTRHLVPASVCLDGRRSRTPTTSWPRCIACEASSLKPRQSYHRAGEFGKDPRPGLALLRLAQGEAKIAAAAIARMFAEAPDRISRCKVAAAVRGDHGGRRARSILPAAQPMNCPRSQRRLNRPSFVPPQRMRWAPSSRRRRPGGCPGPVAPSRFGLAGGRGTL